MFCTNGCGGVLFDNREFAKFDEQHEGITEIEAALTGKELTKKPDESDVRNCPVCGASMVKNYSSIRQSVQVDDCYSCGSKFLDHGELDKIREEYDTDEQRTQAVLEFVTNVTTQAPALINKLPMGGEKLIEG